jgi:hypothetical protein
VAWLGVAWISAGNLSILFEFPSLFLSLFPSFAIFIALALFLFKFALFENEFSSNEGALGVACMLLTLEGVALLGFSRKMLIV